MYKIWDKESDINPPSGPALTAEDVFRQYGWAKLKAATVVIDDVDGMTSEIMNLGVMKRQYNIKKSDPQDVVDEINLIVEQQYEQEAENIQRMSNIIQTDERIAAALEFLALQALDDK